MSDLLIDEMRNELDDRKKLGLVVALVRPLELENDSLQQEKTNLWELGIDHSDQGGKNRGETTRCKLRLDKGAAQQAPTMDDILGEHLSENVLEIGGIHLIHPVINISMHKN